MERYCSDTMFYLGGFIVEVGGELEGSREVGGAGGGGTVPEPCSQNVSPIGADPWQSVGLRIRLFTVYLSGSENWLKPPQASISGILLWFNAKFHLFVQVPVLGCPPWPRNASLGHMAPRPTVGCLRGWTVRGSYRERAWPCSSELKTPC